MEAEQQDEDFPIDENEGEEMVQGKILRLLLLKCLNIDTLRTQTKKN